MTTARLIGDSRIASLPSTQPQTGEIPKTPEEEARHQAWRFAKRAIGLAVLVGCGLVCAIQGEFIVPIVMAVFGGCGLYDVLRNSRRDLFTIDNYFCGNGIGTWLLAPFNLLMDVLSLPHRNKGVYELNDLPASTREEINDLIHSASEADIVRMLENRIGDGRSMMFFKWYGRNLSASADIPAFHKSYQSIQTIGVSVFNKRQSTSWHYGPLRATLRVLYNLRPAADDGAFIEVGRHIHRWNQGPLFIFDDTLMHRSCNETDEVRYCLFVDVIRPSLCPSLMRIIVAGLRCFILPMRYVFYRRWAEIR